MEFSQSMIERYRTQYNLGDIGTVEDTQIGEEKDFLLSEITEVYEEDLFRLEVVFGFDNTTISALIKRNKEVVEALINNEPIPPTPEAIGALPVGAKAADSDKLDGYHASAFAEASHGHSYGNISILDYDGTDMNNNKTTGFSRGYNMTNAAVQLISAFETIVYSPDWITQIQHTISDTPEMYIRSWHSGTTWGGWHRLMHSKNFLNYVYPVGSIYMSVNSTSPATLFGGTWSALPAGRFLRAGTGGTTGGSDTHVHSTAAVALTIGQMPYHNHSIWDLNWEVATGSGGPIATAYSAKYSPSGYTGGNEAHGHGNTGSASNVPAYYEVYAWRRTA